MQLKKGVDFSRVICDERKVGPKGYLSPIKPNTKVIIINHASNVCGTVLPVADIGIWQRRA